MIRSVVPALFGALMLAACAAPGPAPEATVKPVVAATKPPASLATIAKPAPEPAKPRRGLDVADLIGADNLTLVRWFGEPSLDWREGDHALWQYVQDDCVVLLFLEGEAHASRVAAVEVRGRETAEDARCATGFRPRLAEQVH